MPKQVALHAEPWSSGSWARRKDATSKVHIAIRTILIVTIHGRDETGHSFTQNVIASSLSKRGGDSAEAVTTFCLFFRDGFVEDVVRNFKRSEDHLLDNPLEQCRVLELPFDTVDLGC
jgi:hypothetical protein